MTEAAALKAFVAGRISFNAFRNAVAGSTDFVFQPKGTLFVESRRALPSTEVRPADIKRALSRYKKGEVTIEELALWATVVYNLSPFRLEGVAEAAKEELWEVLGEMSLAAVNNAFDDLRVSQLLAKTELLHREAR